MVDVRGRVRTRQEDRRAGLLRWLPRLGLVAGGVAAVAIAYLTLAPVPVPYQGRVVGIDKIFHAIAFAGLVFPVVATGAHRWVWAVPLAIAFGGAIEIVQPHVGRSGMVADFLADVLGVAVGAWLGYRVHRWLHARLAAVRER
jgi:VanZ family protein